MMLLMQPAVEAARMSSRRKNQIPENSENTQPVSLTWNHPEKDAFLTGAKHFITKALHAAEINNVEFPALAKCSCKNRHPYGIAKVTLEMRRRARGVKSNSAASTELRNPKRVECEYASEVTGAVVSHPLATICYEKVGNDEKQPTDAELCVSWRYPGTEVPQLKIPEHLKSVFSRVLVYRPARLEFANLSSLSYDAIPYVDDWPENIMERTGFAGIGRLAKPGNNPMIYIAITRNPNNMHQTEVLVEDNGNSTILPQFVPENGTINERFLKKSIRKISDRCTDYEIKAMIKSTNLLHEGYLKHELNTDNAWMNGSIIHMHDELGNCLVRPPKSISAPKGPYQWYSLSRRGITVNDYARRFIANYK
ncbi:hypothetical protein TTRE_0000812501 [Trichuris trichiura]|uniref:Uncharacterized protein n=1 Tax=Trichuris trichiura TaxID=36087 RepID=A0A077ZMA9_TRITR|nr:hypothetical protein TTRE_0000812501 [Trichuris trichiura]